MVAGSGPSLTQEIAALCVGVPTLVVNDAYRMIPKADALYACDNSWWQVHEGAAGFAGERWSSHGDALRNDKRETAERFGLSLISGRDGDGFSLDPAFVHYGDNSGFQAVNLAGHWMGWRGCIVLVGFDMRQVGGRRHFFGEHPSSLRATTQGYLKWPGIFATAARSMPADLEIINCTPGSALTCFPMMDLRDALAGKGRD